MTEWITLSSLETLSLADAERIGFSGASLAWSDEAWQRARAGRARFEAYLARHQGAYVYGTTTKPGARGKTVMSEADQEQQAPCLRHFMPLRAGVDTGTRLPERTVRLILLARLGNSLAGHGRLSTATVERLGTLLEGPMPPIPLMSATGPGEVIALSWLLAPLADHPLAPGEAMALVNGAPCAAGMITEAAISARRRFELALQTMALAIEAAGAPLGHYDPLLARLTADEDLVAVLRHLAALLEGASLEQRLQHQAPVSWRIIPNILAMAAHAVRRAEEVALFSLRSVSDNPVMLGDEDEFDGLLVSAGGFHNQQSSRALDGLNAAMADLVVLMGKQTARLLDGTPFSLPPFLQPAGTTGIGAEFLAWMQTGHAEQARACAVPATLSPGLEDPQGGQSDVAAMGFLAYRRHLEAAAALDAAMAATFLTCDLALQVQDRRLAPAVQEFRARIGADATAYERRLVDLGDALQRAAQTFTALATGPSEAAEEGP